MMSSPCTEGLVVRLTPQERRLIEEVAEVRRIAPSDLVRELMGLERETQLKQRVQLRVVSA
jgi:hypothetical protein